MRESWDNERAMVIGKQGIKRRTKVRCSYGHIPSVTPQLLHVHITACGRYSYSSYYCSFKYSRFYSILGTVLISGDIVMNKRDIGPFFMEFTFYCKRQ